MPPFWYLMQNKITNKDNQTSQFVTDNATYNKDTHALVVNNAYVSGTKVIFDNTVG